MSSGKGLRVCVIGAGAAGLCAARHVSAQSKWFQKPVVYELNSLLGGTWVYNEQVGADQFGNPIHSSMYERMKTNLPKEVMAFPDFPFPSSPDSFLHHTKIQSYLEQYCRHFALDQFIQYNKKVELVQVQPDQSWLVKVQDLPSQSVAEAIFDVILVCNGHYSVPYYAPISNIERFQGIRMHSHDYRNPTRFQGMNVALLGAAASGIDISLEIAEEATQVYLCHNNPSIPSKLPTNMVQVPGIVECISPQGFVLADGSKVQVDCLLYCTGYEFQFPFLDGSCQVKVENRTVKPLYKHLVHCEHPTMAFLGIPTQICPFPFFHYQLLWYLKTLIHPGSKLPSEADMKADTDREMQERLAQGIPKRHFHKMGAIQWRYMEELAAQADLDPPNPQVEQLYNLVHGRRKTKLTQYKADQFELDHSGKFQLRQ
ncbi:hypothetical protein TCAL_07717 [Tigriopus californicus]|uniref:Flavin-containing monooxygenase n=1 Tax=Tigriopus californicus TaxID=6832 RepID=A0A553NF71_TIGCA|nr:uncharacterized protein LOC131889624 [Tigriopus californicus]TRY64055.1 hypothetical protein TCAL_07717 [Tigriopus californicus]|eukprot:TCALIF_07717-PA protein Name:"Similar to At1g62620 Flavin-containing monooxygenase FMO GS-OX-like 3 (Arabidopsis thaliana)" AED:0.02 eAED:0.02 QI:0/-1/0/1/-1/1/1/0/427